MEVNSFAGPDIFCFSVRSSETHQPRSAGLLADAHALGLLKIQAIICETLYFIKGNLSKNKLDQIGRLLLADPITEQFTWHRMAGGSSAKGYKHGHLPPGTTSTSPANCQTRKIESTLHPGVTDPVATQLQRVIRQLGLHPSVEASTGQRYWIYGNDLTEEDLHLLAHRLLVNKTIQSYTLGEITPSFPQEAVSSFNVDTLSIRDLTDDSLLMLSQERRAALDLQEMKVIQAYFREENREMTDIEFEMIAQTWSEHCVHKTFRAEIILQKSDQDEKRIANLLKTYICSATDEIAAPWVRSAFVDNAGIIDFDDEWEISFKVETHNHPSAIEPFGGANTGIGGVIRDVLGVSAKPIAATDILCFGRSDTPVDSLPEGVLHPRRIRSGVVAGIQDYGNKIGIPTVNGAVYYDEGYIANPLVFCGCVGIAPKNKHVRDALPGDRIIVLGGRTGRDGLRGATFSSMTMDAQTGAVAGASVQIGDPITEKGLVEVTTRARDAGLYHAITDCGAGGLSSAVGEMACQTGGLIQLENVPLKYPGLAPWEIWLSEAQERMVMAVSKSDLPPLQTLADTYDIELTDIGQFTSDKRLVVRYGDQTILSLENDFLHNCNPQRRLHAVGTRPMEIPGEYSIAAGIDWEDLLLSLLSHPNIATKADIIHLYDHEVQGGTVIKPLTGVMNDGPSDACVIKPAQTRGLRGLVLSNGLNPEYGKLDAYRMALCAFDEAIRNAVAVGADPDHIAVLDNFCWGDPMRPETLGTLVAAAQGCRDAALHHRSPFISGKDSLNNEYYGADGQKHSIPPTLLISAIGIVPDVTRTVTMDLKEAGNGLYRIGSFKGRLAGSHAALVCGKLADQVQGPIPGQDEAAPAVYRALYRAIQSGWVRACHDISEGGLAVAVAEMCIGGRMGADLQLEGSCLVDAFGETNGCLIVEVQPQHSSSFTTLFEGLPMVKLGRVTAERWLTITQAGHLHIHLPVDNLVTAWNQTEEVDA